MFSQNELQSALDHVERCEVCRPRFELVLRMASTERKEMSEVPVEPIALLEWAPTAALSEPEAIGRQRAAQRLGDFERLGVPALVGTSGVDENESVWAAARGDENLACPAEGTLRVNPFAVPPREPAGGRLRDP